MDVTCERCSTEYEFDDALVSERGTTVKCTNCGYQFRVRRSTPAGVPDRWVVRTVDGRELQFVALRDLQAAIGQGKIARDDVLSRGSGRPRRLGSIAELEPFFEQAQSSGASRPRIKTGAGLGDALPVRDEGSVAFELPVGPVSAEPATLRQPPPPFRRASSAPPLRSGVRGATPVPPPPRSPTLSGPGLPPSIASGTSETPPLPRQYDRARASELAMRQAEEAELDPADRPTLVTPLDRGPQRRSGAASVPSARRPPPHRPAPPDRSAPPEPAAHASEPPPTPGPSEASFPPPTSDTRASDVRASFYHSDAYVEPRFSSIAPSGRTNVLRWTVGLVVGGLLVLTAVTLGRKYVGAGTSAAAGATADPRAVALLREGERSLLDGDIETAKEQIDKASALAEADPAVAAQGARLAAVRADVRWLHLRLLPADDPHAGVVKRELEQLVDRAEKASERAIGLAPSDAVALRARLDALRLAGKRDEARKLAPRVAESAAHPETALSLAALDLSDEKPDWATVIDRLRTAAAGEQSLGRARALLAYALARSGDATGAQTEVDRLAGFAHPHPLVPALRAFVARPKDGKAIDVASLPDVGGLGGTPAEVAEAIKQGHEARAKGDLSRAQQLFEAALQKSPGSAEAATGLADVARARGDRAAAKAMYEQVLAKRPGFVPAMASLADLLWESGDRAGARALDKQIAERDPNGPYGARAKERMRSAAGATAAAAPSPPVYRGGGPRDDGRVPDDYVAPNAGHIDMSDLPGHAPPPKAHGGAHDAPAGKDKEPAPAPAPAPTSTIPPGVDVSDLPGFKP